MSNMGKMTLIEEWEMVRDDLGIEIVAPYVVDLGDGKKLSVPILVKHFGHKQGMLVVSDFQDLKPYENQVWAMGYGMSVLEEPTEPYDREVMIELLSDWGWTGDPARKPAWVRDPEPDNAEGTDP
jgi:hypothetical protein